MGYINSGFYKDLEKLKINKKIIKKLSKATILVIRVVKKKLTMSKPCQHCISFMRNLGIKQVCYSDINGNLILEKIKNITTNHICLANKKLPN